MGIVTTVLVPEQHPAFAGHFPGAPLLPGVVLLDEMLRVVEEARGGGGVGRAGVATGAVASTDGVGGGAVASAAAGNAGDAAGTTNAAAGATATTGDAAVTAGGAAAVGASSGWTIATAKFLQPVRPGDELIVEHEALTNGAVRFAIRSAGRAVATGTLVPRLEATERDHGHQAG